ncbi:hypothetical protein BN1088_1431478 [Sphingobacterium sp. PM2-P1-29]|nr:hypothetical protein BN1088_1431478 [Sphingobacterium sp. PM2-P1-29]
MCSELIFLFGFAVNEASLPHAANKNLLITTVDDNNPMISFLFISTATFRFVFIIQIYNLITYFCIVLY